MVQIQNVADGKPRLSATDPATEEIFTGADLSLADSGALSMAAVGLGAIGADIEKVETRNAELWRGLLGDAGYDLALRLTRETHEPFDTAARR